jgi:glucose-6-phosphate 1-dehydrogenase
MTRKTATVRVSKAGLRETSCLEAKAPEPCTLVIFGITGDLAGRKLIPALYQLAAEGSLPEKFCVVGVSRSAKDADALRAKLLEGVKKHSRSGFDASVWERLASCIHCVAGSAKDEEPYGRLKVKLEDLDAEHGIPGNRLFYLAVAPSIFPPILNHLKGVGLIRSADEESWSRVIVEKPFGIDLPSAQELNRLVGEVLDEQQTYRIDHYLGKETVQNLLVLRFANSIFEPLWSRKYIDHVQVTAAESLLVTNRGAFYDEAGVVRDIVQNHLLQILALVTMEPPVSLDGDDVRDQKVQAIRSLRPVDPEDVVFAQYEGYRDVEGVADDSRTPTFMGVKAMIDNWRWHGVPFYLRAGKGLKARDTEVAITFRKVPSVLFGKGNVEPNQLVLQIQPGDGISLSFSSKVPGDGVKIGTVNMDMTYAEAFEEKAGDAYERLLLDSMRGDATLFARRDEVEEAWRWVDPFLKAWESGNGNVPSYAVGSDGPPEVLDLIDRDNRKWRPLGE